MPVFAKWRAERDLVRRTGAYVRAIMQEPAAADVAWLATVATKGDDDHARWELRYARRAMGLVAAERDALDDRTASAVARELDAEIARDRSIAADRLEVSMRQYNARLSAYRDVLGARAGAATAARLGQTLFAFCGAAFGEVDPAVVRGGELLMGYLAEASTALREQFGAASLS